MKYGGVILRQHGDGGYSDWRETMTLASAG
jgi:hypothetical protein